MPLTRSEADQIAEEARQQGWEGDKHIVDLGDGDWYNEGHGSVTVHDWDAINRKRRELGNEPWSATGCSVELRFPGLMGPKYWVSERDEWRKLKAKVDELGEIIRQVHERGWEISSFSHPQKVGRFGMMIEIVPPGASRAYPKRIGGMRTWRKLCREYDEMIEIREPAGEIEA